MGSEIRHGGKICFVISVVFKCQIMPNFVQDVEIDFESYYSRWLLCSPIDRY